MSILTSAISDRLLEKSTQILTDADLGEAEDRCSKILRPHKLLTTNKSSRLRARLNHLQVGDFSLNRLFYGENVTVVPVEPADGDFLITMPLTGTAAFHYGKTSAALSPGRGAIVGPYERCKLSIDSNFDQILLRLSRQHVELACARILGTEKVSPVHFELALTGIPSFWYKLLETALDVSMFAETAKYPILFAQLEGIVIDAILLAQPHNHSTSFLASSKPAHSLLVRKAMEFMQEHIGETLRLSHVARACGVSLRSLQAGFQRDLGLSPGQWLRAERLDRVHTVLKLATPGSVTITDVAFEWGFTHLGDFSALFRRRFGESPSTVLAKDPY